jgi:hypothetical protein
MLRTPSIWCFGVIGLFSKLFIHQKCNKNIKDICLEISGYLSSNILKYLDIYQQISSNIWIFIFKYPQISGYLSSNIWIFINKYPQISGYLSSNILKYLDIYLQISSNILVISMEYQEDVSRQQNWIFIIEDLDCCKYIIWNVANTPFLQIKIMTWYLNMSQLVCLLSICNSSISCCLSVRFWWNWCQNIGNFFLYKAVNSDHDSHSHATRDNNKTTKNRTKLFFVYSLTFLFSFTKYPKDKNGKQLWKSSKGFSFTPFSLTFIVLV